jgi:hypothetical protein
MPQPYLHRQIVRSNPAHSKRSLRETAGGRPTGSSLGYAVKQVAALHAAGAEPRRVAARHAAGSVFGRALANFPRLRGGGR